MNCQSVRHQILVDPTYLGPEEQQHSLACPGCRSFLQSVLHNDDLLRTVIMDAHSDGLQERLNAEAAFSKSRRRFVTGVAAVFATFSATSLGVYFHRRPGAEGGGDWVQVLVEHLDEDPQHLLPADPTASAHMQTVLSQMNGRQTKELPPIVRADTCLLQGKIAAHLVLDIDSVRAVVFLVGDQVEPAAFSITGWAGEVRSIPGGFVAVIAPSRKMVEQLGLAFSESIQLTTA